MADFDSFDALSDSPKDRALPVDVGGLTLPWLVDGLTIKRAQQKGYELGEILGELEALSGLADEETDVEDAINAAGDAYEAAARLLWLGFLRFEDVDYDQVLGLVGPDTIADLPLAAMMSRLFPDAEEDSGKAKEGAGAT